MTENVELNIRRNQFLAPIIQSIQLEMDEFMIRVANQECHEVMMYRWAIRLFEKGVSSDYAISVIHRARRFVLINKTNKYPPKQPMQTLQKILVLLKQHPKYIALDDHAKTIVQNDVIEAVLNSDHRIEAIEEALEEREERNIINVLGNRVMNLARKWGLTRNGKNSSNH